MINVNFNINDSNRLSAIIEAITRYSLGELVDDPQNKYSGYVSEAHDFAEWLGDEDAKTRKDDPLNPKTLDDCLPAAFADKYYPELRRSWLFGWNERVEREEREEEYAEMHRRYPDVEEGHTVFCPHGHNQIETTGGFEECAACGSYMLPHSEEQYYNNLRRVGACG